MAETLRFLFIGDVVGQPGQVMFQKHVMRLKHEHEVDAIIVNGENAAYNGRGIGTKQITFFKHNGADVITSGNHIWGQKESYAMIQEQAEFVLRPANFPASCPGKGYTLFSCDNSLVAVINVQGRVFMQHHVDCPFKTVESLLTFLQTQTSIIIVDIHAEATSEKKSLGFFLDGKVSAVIGTHTHVPTADEGILPGGTAYITDAGFCGALYSSLGVKKEPVIKKFLTQMPQRFSVEDSGPYVLNGVIFTVNKQTGKALDIKRVRLIDDQAHEQLEHN